VRKIYGSNPRATIQRLLYRRDSNAKDQILVTTIGQHSFGLERANEVVVDLDEIQDDISLSPTERKSLRLARLGQGRYRVDLLRLWNDSCAVTGCALPAVLRASHIKPWRDSNARERLDPHNGLPLIATMDALFDQFLIRFDDEGKMLVSSILATEERDLLGPPIDLRADLNDFQKSYLRYHRERLR
jgi:predicted restriction endonuclease